MTLLLAPEKAEIISNLCNQIFQENSGPYKLLKHDRKDRCLCMVKINNNENNKEEKKHFIVQFFESFFELENSLAVSSVLGRKSLGLLNYYRIRTYGLENPFIMKMVEPPGQMKKLKVRLSQTSTGKLRNLPTLVHNIGSELIKCKSQVPGRLKYGVYKGNELQKIITTYPGLKWNGESDFLSNEPIGEETWDCLEYFESLVERRRYSAWQDSAIGSKRGIIKPQFFDKLNDLIRHIGQALAFENMDFVLYSKSVSTDYILVDENCTKLVIPEFKDAEYVPFIVGTPKVINELIEDYKVKKVNKWFTKLEHKIPMWLKVNGGFSAQEITMVNIVNKLHDQLRTDPSGNIESWVLNFRSIRIEWTKCIREEPPSQSDDAQEVEELRGRSSTPRLTQQHEQENEIRKRIENCVDQLPMPAGCKVAFREIKDSTSQTRNFLILPYCRKVCTGWFLRLDMSMERPVLLGQEVIDHVLSKGLERCSKVIIPKPCAYTKVVQLQDILLFPFTGYQMSKGVPLTSAMLTETVAKELGNIARFMIETTNPYAKVASVDNVDYEEYAIPVHWEAQVDEFTWKLQYTKQYTIYDFIKYQLKRWQKVAYEEITDRRISQSYQKLIHQVLSMAKQLDQMDLLGPEKFCLLHPQFFQVDHSPILIEQGENGEEGVEITMVMWEQALYVPQILLSTKPGWCADDDSEDEISTYSKQLGQFGEYYYGNKQFDYARAVCNACLTGLRTLKEQEQMEQMLEDWNNQIHP